MKREPGIDLVRVMGLFFVNGIHFFLKNGYYGEPQIGFAIWGANCFRWLFFSCNGLFLLLTGYLKSTKPFTKDYYKGLIPILAGYSLTCLITYPIRHFALGERLSMFEWIGNFLTFSNYSWYLEMYIGLILFSPIINLALAQIKEERTLLTITGVMVALTALPSVTAINLIPDYWTSLYPVTYYVIGAVIRKLQPQIKSWLCLTLGAAFSMWLGLVTLITDDGISQGYGGFWVTIIITFVFLGLYRINLGSRAAKVLAWLSGGVFEGYILSRLLDTWLYSLLPQWHTPGKYPLLFFCVTIPIFIISILAGKALHELAQRICRPKHSRTVKTPVS